MSEKLSNIPGQSFHSWKYNTKVIADVTIHKAICVGIKQCKTALGKFLDSYCVLTDSQKGVSVDLKCSLPAFSRVTWFKCVLIFIKTAFVDSVPSGSWYVNRSSKVFSLGFC